MPTGRLLLCCITVALLAAPCRAETLVVRSKHQRLSLVLGEQRSRYLWLKPDEMLLIRVAGPINIGLRLRNLTGKEGSTSPVDLTVVRDDQEQGTVRFRLPATDGASVPERQDITVSGEVLVKIEVPPGQHLYRVLASVPGRGVILKAFTGLEAKERVIVATPGKTRVPPPEAVTPAKPGPKPPAKPKPPPKVVARAPSAPEEEILQPVEYVDPGGLKYQMTTIHHSPEGPGPGTRISASASVLFLLGTASLLASASSINDDARAEPVQIQAGELFYRSERTYQASYVMGGLTVAAALAALVFYLVEEPAADMPTGPGIRF